MDNIYQSSLQTKAQLASELSTLESQIALAQSEHHAQQQQLAEKQKGVNLSLQEVEKLQQLRIEKVNALKKADESLSSQEKKLYNQLQQEFSQLKKKSQQLNDLVKQAFRLYGEVLEDSKTLDSKGYRQLTQKPALSIPEEFNSSIASPDFRYAVMQHLLVAAIHNETISLIPISRMNGFLNG